MGHSRWRDENYITDWKQFRQFRYTLKTELLNRLNYFPNSILIAGCQRSGTTMLSRVINASDELTKYWFTPDDELDAALILSGYVEHDPQGRYCFQTTYVNECYLEYIKCNDLHKIIWIIRNPYSVIYSMIYNWKEIALSGLKINSSRFSTSGIDKWASNLIGYLGLSKLHKACWWYKEKSAQIFELYEELNDNSLMIVDYDDLVKNKDKILPLVFQFLNLEYYPRFAELIQSGSLDKSKKLSLYEKNMIKRLCVEDYLRARELVSSKY